MNARRSAGDKEINEFPTHFNVQISAHANPILFQEAINIGEHYKFTRADLYQTATTL